jgi:outer membrane protein OmpA-like peptidoglycan-associated protein
MDGFRRALAAAAFAAVALVARAQDPYPDAWDPATEAAAEAAAAKLGAQRAIGIVATTRDIVGLEARAISATVKDLKQAMADLGARESDLEVRIELPSDVLFDVDKADIRPDAAQALAHVGTVVRSYSGPVRLVGHTDSDGSDAHNMGLSQRRAESVKAWLVAKESVDAARFSIEAKGESQPVAANDTAANKQRNRRVEVVVRKR